MCKGNPISVQAQVLSSGTSLESKSTNWTLPRASACDTGRGRTCATQFERAWQSTLLGKTDTFVNILQYSTLPGNLSKTNPILVFSTLNPIITCTIRGLTPQELHEACRDPASAQKTSSVAGVSPSSSYQLTKCRATQRMNVCVCACVMVSR